MGLAAAATGFVLANTWVAVAGLVAYAVGTVAALVPFVRTLVRRRPRRPAPWLLLCGVCWLVAAVAVDAGRLAWDGSLRGVSATVDLLVPVLVVGFGAQVLVGALTQLLPAVLGRGPSEHRQVSAALERGWLPRVVAWNVAVPLVALELPAPVQLVSWALVAVSFGWFVLLGVRVALPVAVHGALSEPRRGSGVVPGVAVGLAVTLAAVLVGTGSGVGQATGPVRVVDVTLADMRITPASLVVPEGTHLRLRVTGAQTDQLGEGDTELLDAGTIRGDTDGWCTVAGHRAAGMTMTIRTSDHTQSAQGHGAAGEPSHGRQPRDATLPATPTGRLHRVELRVTEREVEVAPGRREARWTRGNVGDRFEITLVNDGTMGHSIDFHAGSLAPDEPMRTVGPGERVEYRFIAERAGAWLYHCSTAPMSHHIANGMYGAVVIDPPRLRPVDREYLLVGAQLYDGDPASDAQVAKIRAGRPDGWQFNGMAAQYDHAPLKARVGERVRFWVVNAGPGDAMSFHVVCGQFDAVYKEGAWLLRRGGTGGAQALDVAPAQGGFVELTFPEPGRYPFVDHDMRHTEGGAHGYVDVTR